jgi:hypothetical protein
LTNYRYRVIAHCSILALRQFLDRGQMVGTERFYYIEIVKRAGRQDQGYGANAL